MPFGIITRGDVEDIDPSEATVVLIAGTFNISSCKRINGVKWLSFTEDQQKDYLMKILRLGIEKYRFSLYEMYYEKCPHYGQIHMHFTLKTDPSNIDFYLLRHFIEKKCGLPEKFKYKTIVLKYINAQKGWHNYITKDI